MKNNLFVDPNTTSGNETGAWRTYRPIIDATKCIACGTCTAICPESAISLKESNNKKFAIGDLKYCKSCGICAQECPVKCILMVLDKK